MKSEYLLCRFDCYCIVSRICWLSSKINQQTKSTVLDFCLIFVKIICRAFRQFLIRHPFPRHQFADMYPGYWPSYCYFQNNTFYQQGFVSVVILIFNSCIVLPTSESIKISYHQTMPSNHNQSPNYLPTYWVDYTYIIQ